MVLDNFFTYSRHDLPLLTLTKLLLNNASNAPTHS